MINRRRFLKLAGAGAAGAIVAPMSLVSARAEQVPWVDKLLFSQEAMDAYLYYRGLWEYRMIVRNHPIAIRELGSRDSAYGHAGYVPAEMIEQLMEKNIPVDLIWRRFEYDWSNAKVEIVNPPESPAEPYALTGDRDPCIVNDGMVTRWRSPAWTD